MAKSYIFQHIEKVQGSNPWGNLLDAGAGVNSLNWICELDTDQWVGVTADARNASILRERLGEKIRSDDQIIFGRWEDRDLLGEKVFDTVLVDYVIGAMDGISPYFQYFFFQRLRRHVKSRVYVTGLEPYTAGPPPQTLAGKFIWDMGRFRDACALLAGIMPYREYPQFCVTEFLTNKGYKVKDIARLPAMYDKSFVSNQLEACRRLLGLIDPSIANGLAAQVSGLEARGLDILETEGALHHGFSYVIAADVTRDR